MPYKFLTLMDIIQHDDYVPDDGELCSNGYIFILGDGVHAICELDNIAVILSDKDKARVKQYIAEQENDTSIESYNNTVPIRYFSYDSDLLNTFIPLKGEVIVIYNIDGEYNYKIGDGINVVSNLPFVLFEELNKVHGLGCLKSPYDERDYQFSDLLTRSKKEIFPTEYLKIKDEITSVFDQLDSNMCCACACAMSRYIYELGDSKNSKLFSPAYIYGNRVSSTVIDGVYEGEGMYLRDAMKQLCRAGDCYYDTLPGFGLYEKIKNDYNNTKLITDKEAYPYRTSSYYAVKTDSEIMKAIMTTGSVLASYIVTSGWYTVGSDGIIPTYGNLEGGHAVLIIGWKIINNKRYWIILNSWGNEWGDHGFGYIESTENMMEAYCILDEVHELNFKEGLM